MSLMSRLYRDAIIFLCLGVVGVLAAVAYMDHTRTTELWMWANRINTQIAAAANKAQPSADAPKVAEPEAPKKK